MTSSTRWEQTTTSKQGYGSVPPLHKAGVQRHEKGSCPCGNCCVAVPQDRYYAVEKFGEYIKILGPGFSCVGCDLCGMCINFRSITKRVEQNDCLVETKTKDNVFVVVHVAVQQSVDPDHTESAIYRLADVSAQVDSYVSDVVRSHLPHMSLDDAFSKKDDISDAIMKELATHMTAYGFIIHKALVTEVRPNQEVMASMNEINKQERLRAAALMAGEAEKIRVVKAAEAAADAACLQGEGIARQRAAIVKGLKESIQTTSGEPLTQSRISELLLISQYFETLKEIGAQSKAQVVFLPHSAGEGIADMAAQIRNGVLQSNAAVTPPGQASMS